MNASIVIDGLEVRAIIGVHAHERTLPQRLRLDLRVDVDAAAAAARDELAATLDYSALCRRVTEIATRGRFRLVETLACAIAEALEAEFGARRFRLRVLKPDAVAAARGGVGIEVTRDG